MFHGPFLAVVSRASNLRAVIVFYFGLFLDWCCGLLHCLICVFVPRMSFSDCPHERVCIGVGVRPFCPV